MIKDKRTYNYKVSILELNLRKMKYTELNTLCFYDYEIYKNIIKW